MRDEYAYYYDFKKQKCISYYCSGYNSSGSSSLYLDTTRFINGKEKCSVVVVHLAINAFISKNKYRRLNTRECRRSSGRDTQIHYIQGLLRKQAVRATAALTVMVTVRVS